MNPPIVAAPSALENSKIIDTDKTLNKDRGRKAKIFITIALNPNSRDLASTKCSMLGTQIDREEEAIENN